MAREYLHYPGVPSAEEKEEIERTAYLEDKRREDDGIREEERLQAIEETMRQLDRRVGALEKASIYPA